MVNHWSPNAVGNRNLDAYTGLMICCNCKNDLEFSNFSFKNKATGKRSSICKGCHAIYRKQHYSINKEKYIKKALVWNARQAKILSTYLFELLSKSRCIDCGENDIVVLDFDHLENKRLGIAEMYKNRYSIEAINDEIKKCVVRCANCHRKKTAREQGTWKFKLFEKFRGMA